MNIPEGFKLVPVEPTDEMLYTASWVHGPGGFGEVKRRIGLEYRAALSVAPTPPQPIYDEAKERELFEAHCAKVGLPTDTLPSGEYLIPATRFMSQGWHARAKAGEDE